MPYGKKKLRKKKKPEREGEFKNSIHFFHNKSNRKHPLDATKPPVGRFQNNASKEGIVFARWKRILGQVASDAAEDDLRSHELRAGNGDASRLNSAVGAGKGRGHAAGRGTPSTSFVLGSPC